MTNWYGTWSLFRRESHRFLKVWGQTIGTPLISALLYFAVFGGALGHRIGTADGIGYLQFLVPGLAAMGMFMHAFQNSSSSLIQMKYLGMLPADLLALPLSSLQVVIAFVGSAIVRGTLVGLGTLLVSRIFVDYGVAHPLYFVLATFLITGIAGLIGLLTGIWGKNFDDVSSISNFIITPLIFLGGVFFSISMLPDSWQSIARFNPVYYLVDLLRYSLLDTSQANPAAAAGAVGLFFLLLFTVTVVVIRRGWRLKT